MIKYVVTAILTTSCALFLIALFHFHQRVIVGELQLLRQEQAAREQKITYENNGTTTHGLFSLFTGYYKVNQNKPGKVCVKKISEFKKMVDDECNEKGQYIFSIVPLGEGVRIDDELAYQAVIVTYAPRMGR